MPSRSNKSTRSRSRSHSRRLYQEDDRRRSSRRRQPSHYLTDFSSTGEESGSDSSCSDAGDFDSDLQSNISFDDESIGSTEASNTTDQPTVDDSVNDVDDDEDDGPLVIEHRRVSASSSNVDNNSRNLQSPIGKRGGKSSGRRGRRSKGKQLSSANQMDVAIERFRDMIRRHPSHSARRDTSRPTSHNNNLETVKETLNQLVADVALIKNLVREIRSKVFGDPASFVEQTITVR